MEQDVFVTKVPLEKAFIETAMEDGGLNGGLNELLECINLNPGKRTNELAETISVPPKTVEKWLALLKKEGKIKFVGSKKTGGYYII